MNNFDSYDKAPKPYVNTDSLPENVIEHTANNARHYWLVCEFAKGTSLTPKQMANISGASNPDFEIEKLRKLGWNLIATPSKGVDRLGRLYYFDRYHLSTIQLTDAIKVVEFFNDAA
jgi:hypothetical protein